MNYTDTRAGLFLDRPSRFIAHASLGGETVAAHVKNTGRCRELLVAGARVILQRSGSSGRKTGYDLVAVWKGDKLINIDSGAPNAVFREYLQSGRYIDEITLIKPESTYKNSRFDFYVEANGRKIYIEVKGVTLEREGTALFPDAPTERGVKHLKDLSECISGGFEAHVVFVVQMRDVRYFAPNREIHPAFGRALAEAAGAGVKVSAFDCAVTENSLTIGNAVPVHL